MGIAMFPEALTARNIFIKKQLCSAGINIFLAVPKSAAILKDKFLEFIKDQLKLMENCEEKELYVFNADFFSLIKK